MPKVTIEFQLPEEQEELKDAQKGTEYNIVLFDIDQYLRNEIKHGNHLQVEYDIFQRVRDKLHELLNEREINL